MKKYLKMTGYIALYIAAYFAIFQGAIYLWEHVLPGLPAIGPWVKNNRLGLVIFNDILALPLFALLIFGIKKRSILKETLFTPISPGNILLSILIGFGMGIFVVNFFALPFIREIPIFEELLAYMYDAHILTFAGFVLIGTFFKEILFRGLIFRELEKALPLIAAILIHAVLYGALFFYFNIPLTLFAILGNIVVVLAYISTRSIWAAYIAQAANNVCIYLIRNVTGDFFTGLRIPMIIISGILICGALFLMFNKRKEQELETEAA